MAAITGNGQRGERMGVFPDHRGQIRVTGALDGGRSDSVQVTHVAPAQNARPLAGQDDRRTSPGIRLGPA